MEERVEDFSNISLCRFVSVLHPQTWNVQKAAQNGGNMKLVIDRLSKQYKNKIAVDRVSAEFNNGV